MGNNAKVKVKVKVKKDNYNFINIVAVIACLGVIVVILTVLFASYIFDRSSQTDGQSSAEESPAESSGDELSSDDSTDASPGESSADESGMDASTEASADGSFSIVALDREEIRRGTLIIVNGDNPYDFSRETPLVGIYEKRTQNYKLIDGSLKIAPDVMDRLNEMLDGLYGAVNLNSLTLTAAYRDKTAQQAAYDQGKDTAAGGYSDLHTGYSFKCTIYPTSDGSLTEGKFLWLAENCKYYGFVLRYPEGKSSITGTSAASNFFRYVGEPHAYLMALNDYCLEEYVDFCKRFSYENQYKIEYDGIKYAIYYAEASLSGVTEIKVPEGCEYVVSGDNSSGFIITAVMG